MFSNFLPKEAEAFGNNIKKKPQKPCTELKKYIYHIFTENICYACNLAQVIAFCKNVSTS